MRLLHEDGKGGSMSFLSFTFLIFVLTIFCLYYIVPYPLQWIILLVASLWFYLMFDLRSVIFLLASTTAVFAAALYIGGDGRFKKCVAVLGIAVNIFLLAALKYSSFIEGALWRDGIFSRFHTCVVERFSLAIPLGISFYTLSLIGYLADVYRKKYGPERNFMRFLLYACFFPHIMQGPIARYDQLAGQFRRQHEPNYERTMYAVQYMVWGYIKKMVIADRAAVFVDAVYGSYGTAGGTELFIASIFYSIQIYADFSGCVDIAAGTAKLFDIDLMQNFRQPYMACSIKDFWKRWHISLSSWYMDYVYFPIGGDKGQLRRYINIFVVFCISGLWHGAGWHYIVWGLLHGFCQVAGYLFGPLKKRTAAMMGIRDKSVVARAVHIAATFLIVNFAWIFFWAGSMHEALGIVISIFRYPSLWALTDGSLYEYGLSVNMFHVLLVWIAVLFFVDILHERGISIREKIARQALPVRWIIYYAAVFSIVFFGAYGMGYHASDFIYMQF